MANRGNPAQDSTLAPGGTPAGDLHAESDGNQQFDDLSPRRREEILRSQQDGFPAGYEDLLAEYYARLASEEALDDEPSENVDE
ncbi:MAG: hypothetical protein ACIAXF_09150 [Phycisphaerales bacterium JB063]